MTLKARCPSGCEEGVVAEEEPPPLGGEVHVDEQRLDQQAGRDGQDRTQDEKSTRSGTGN